MRWLLMIVSVMMQKFLPHDSAPGLNPAREMKEFVLKNAKKVLFAITVTNILALMFVSGLFMMVMSAAVQYDRAGLIFFNAVMVGGMGLTLLSSIGCGILFSSSSVDKREREIRQTPAPKLQPLEEALVNLISDFIKEKEAKRAEKHAEVAKQELAKSKERVPSGVEAIPEYDH